MSDEEAWLEMWKRKAEGREMFAQATLTRRVEFTQWLGHGSPQVNYHADPGTRVLITMASRFGDIGIRGNNISEEVHGYDARVEPDALKDLKFLSDGGKPWRKELLDRITKKEKSDVPK